MSPVVVYRTGFWHDVFVAFRSARHGRWDAARQLPAKVRRSWRQRSYWNGWLAEPETWPEGLQRCGSGWTSTRAVHDLARRVAALNGEATG